MSNDPRKTHITLSRQPEGDWVAAFFKHWRQAVNNLHPKPEVRFDGKVLSVICPSDFASQYIATVRNCIDKANEARAITIKREGN
jgi:hypothetical protein